MAFSSSSTLSRKTTCFFLNWHVFVWYVFVWYVYVWDVDEYMDMDINNKIANPTDAKLATMV